MKTDKPLDATVDASAARGSALWIAAMRKDWETGDYECHFEDFLQWWMQ